MKRTPFGRIVLSWTLIAAAAAGGALAEDSRSVNGHAEAPPAVLVDADGTVHLPPLAVPLSSYLSPQARAGTAAYFRFLQTPASELFMRPPEPASLAEQRRQFAEHYRPVLERVKQLYPTQSAAATLGGVRVDVITPAAGIAAGNKDRVLINLHGGGFSMGAQTMSALESIPVASLGRIKVVTVDYRQALEYKFPAASEDVATVYRELLKTYRPQSIGIYGCSAGGFLTAEAVAWIQKEHLPAPGAIGIFCASASGWFGGDSRYLALPLIGIKTTSQVATQRHPSVPDRAYFSEADLNDPLVVPMNSPSVMARFPPTLLITSTRDNAMSSVVHTHAQLIKLGVEADLHVWEGLPHSFFTFEPDFPESREVWDVVVRFFDTHLSAS
jgi:acetyl esterase/lipase